MKGIIVGNLIFCAIIIGIMLGTSINLISNIIFLIILGGLVVALGLVGTKFSNKIDIIVSIVFFIIVSLLIAIKLCF